jgi:uncharacterized membrane protein
MDSLSRARKCRVAGLCTGLRKAVSHMWFVVRWLHLLAVTFFVGGQLVLAVAVVPVERRYPDRERLGEIAQRFGYGTLVALGVLIVTGSAMASHLHLWGDHTFQLKLALVVVVAILLVWHVRRPTLHVLEAVVFLLSLAIVWIGLYLANGYS